MTTFKQFLGEEDLWNWLLGRLDRQPPTHVPPPSKTPEQLLGELTAAEHSGDQTKVQRACEQITKAGYVIKVERKLVPKPYQGTSTGG